MHISNNDIYQNFFSIGKWKKYKAALYTDVDDAETEPNHLTKAGIEEE